MRCLVNMSIEKEIENIKWDAIGFGELSRKNEKLVQLK